ncbi:MAG: cellulase family glycosylhydrolase [Oscillospiraceae bacterium]
MRKLNRKSLSALILAAALTLTACAGTESSLADSQSTASVSESVGGETRHAETTPAQSVSQSAPNENPAESTTGSVSAEPEEIGQTEPTSSQGGGSDSQPAEQTQSSSQQTAATTAKPQEQRPAENKDGAELLISCGNSWSDGVNNFTQVDGIVRSKSVYIDGWKAVLTVASDTAIDQSWCCELSQSGSKLTVTPMDFNCTVAAGSEVTFGFILKNCGTIDPAKCSLDYGTGTAPAQGGGNQNNNNNNSNNNNNNGGTPTPAVNAKEVPEPTTDDWLSVKGNKIVDKNGKEVWLTGCNWFGYNTGTNTFDGLWACDLNSSIAAIADRGFNLLRVPISTELINQWAAGTYPSANFNQATNYYLVGMNSLEIFDYVIGQCRANGLKIMIDIHCAKTDAMGHMKNMWYEGSITEKEYLAALSWIAKRYRNDDTILAYDLENEPHGKAFESPRAKWDSSTDPDNWKYVAEKAAMAVLNENPNALVMIEGIEIYPRDLKKNGNFKSTDMKDYYSTWWGGNLRGVKDNPIDIGRFNNKVVYSPHDYGPAVYEQEWFKGDYTFDSLYKDAWYDNWFYIQKTGTAPLLIGEWGGYMTQPNLKWMTYLRKLIKENRINHTFWCFNANSGDTGGLVKDDFVTWDEEKYEFVKEVLWQENGKFVGLDHVIPLGNNGVALS